MPIEPVASQPPEPASAGYCRRYGLVTDPFLDDPKFPFFGGGGRRELLNQLVHLCQFSAGMLTLSGEAGFGKSRLARALFDTLDSDDSCLLSAEPQLDKATLLQRISSDLGIPLPAGGTGDQWLARLHRFSQWVAESDAPTVVIVDNAHRLGNEALEALLGLLSAALQDDPESGLHLALFGEPPLASRVADMDPQLPAQHFALEPLSLADASDYLNFRMEMCDYLGPELFSPALVSPWWRSAAGDLTLLQQMAAQWLMVSGEEQPAGQKSSGRSVLPLPHILAVAGLMAVLLVLLFYRAGREPDGPPALPQSEPPEPVALLQERAQPVSEAAPVGGITGEELDRHEQDRPDAQLEEGEAPTEQPEVEADVVEPTPAPPEVSSPLNNLPEDEQVLLSWRASEYTLQLLGASSEQMVREYVSRQPNRDQLLVYRGEREGEDWWRVVIGRYPDGDNAREAVQSLPDYQREAGPWPRSLNQIQSEIKRSRGL